VTRQIIYHVYFGGFVIVGHHGTVARGLDSQLKEAGFESCFHTFGNYIATVNSAV